MIYKANGRIFFSEPHEPGISDDYKKVHFQIFFRYQGIDEAHGQLHINECYHWAKKGYLLTPRIQRDYDREFVYLCVIMHDLGLCPNNIAWLQGNDRFDHDNDIIRKYHNIRSGEIMRKLYASTEQSDMGVNIKLFKNIVSSDKLCEEGAHALEHHRASVEQITDLDKFLRCCDGLNTWQMIMTRIYLYNSVHHQDDFAENAFDYVYKKYLSKDGTNHTLPFKWANDMLKEELKQLKKHMEMLDRNSPTLVDDWVRVMSMKS